MIKELVLQNCRNITNTFKFNKGLNVLSGKNGVGKSTIINSIIESFRGDKIKIKEGSMMLNYDDIIINRERNKLFNSPQDNIDLCIPGTLMGKYKTIKGVNSTNEERRTTLSNLLGIDRTKFFLDNGIDYDVKGLKSKIRDMDVTSNTYTSELIELNQEEIEEVLEPVEVELISTVGEYIKKGNKEELARLKYNLDDKKKQLVTITKSGLTKPDEVILVEGNEAELQSLNNALVDIKTEGINIPSNCSKCGQSIIDADKQKELLRTEYIKKQEEINNFVLVKNNGIEYTNYISKLQEYNNSLNETKINKERNDIVNEEIKEFELKIKEFKLIEDEVIGGAKGNEEEYNIYRENKTKFELYKQSINSRDTKLKDLKSKIKGLSTSDLVDKIERYKEVELDFINIIDSKLTVGDLKFKFYKRNISPNSESEYSAIFTVEYKGVLYEELSGGEQGMVDVIIAKLFIDSNSIIDFILIDNAEISNENIKNIVTNYCNDIQVIVTRISNKDLIINNKL